MKVWWFRKILRPCEFGMVEKDDNARPPSVWVRWLDGNLYRYKEDDIGRGLIGVDDDVYEHAQRLREQPINLLME